MDDQKTIFFETISEIRQNSFVFQGCDGVKERYEALHKAFPEMGFLTLEMMKKLILTLQSEDGLDFEVKLPRPAGSPVFPPIFFEIYFPKAKETAVV